jgi:hypothetical protein
MSESDAMSISEIPDEKNVIKPMAAKWEEILRHMESTQESEWKFAVIEADKLLDIAIKNAGFQGETLGERLMGIKEGQIGNLQDLWSAHKIRNRLAHDVGYFLRYTEAKQAVRAYEQTLKELRAI